MPRLLMSSIRPLDVALWHGSQEQGTVQFRPSKSVSTVYPTSDIEANHDEPDRKWPIEVRAMSKKASTSLW